MIDKNLFLYDLAVVTIMKNEGRYIKEWLDYHLLAGVDHFYLYDNDSPDNQAEVAAPYVEAGLVDYIHAPGKFMQYAVYNDAAKRFKFQCRYMAFIDADEFIFPKTNQSIVETLDEILSRDVKASGVAINWQFFGSNGQQTADYSRGVLERFTRRAPVDWTPNNRGNAHVKTVANPRAINFIAHPHFPYYFGGFHSVNENGAIVPEWRNFPVTADKLVIHHYYTKSKEEYEHAKMLRGWACENKHIYNMGQFEFNDRNEIFDDGILRYRAARAENFSLPSDEQRFRRVHDALTKILSAYASGKTFSLETALTCRAASSYLREKFPSDERFKVYEEASLAAVLNSLDALNFSDVQLLLNELPDLLKLPYPVVDELRGACLQIIPRLMEFMRLNALWKDFVDLDNLRRLLEAWR